MTPVTPEYLFNEDLYFKLVFTNVEHKLFFIAIDCGFARVAVDFVKSFTLSNQYFFVDEG